MGGTLQSPGQELRLSAGVAVRAVGGHLASTPFLCVLEESCCVTLCLGASRLKAQRPHLVETSSTAEMRVCLHSLNVPPDRWLLEAHYEWLSRVRRLPPLAPTKLAEVRLSPLGLSS